MIVDGGLGAELAQRGYQFSTTLWSAEAILTRPDLLVAIHRDYLAAGAEVLATATYQLSHGALRARGFSEVAIDGVFLRAVQLARDAIVAHRADTGSARRYVVAASLGPFGATVGDGSEYSGKQHLDRDALYAFHVERIRSMLRAQPDVLLFETIPSLTEAVVIAEVARDLGLEGVWISLACRDGTHTFGGDRMRDVIEALDAFACIEVVGVNCTAPDAIASLIGAMKAGSEKAILVCPNLGQHWENDTHALAGGTSEAEFMRRVPEWLGLGVTHVGGCCGVGPNTIAKIAAVAAEGGAIRP